MWSQAIQEKWSYSYREAESSMQGLWPTVCLGRYKPRDHCGATYTGGTLTREKISLHGICRAVGVSMRWLMHFIVTCFAASPDHLHVQPVASPREVLIGRFEVEADEMWSFVKQKANKQWIWIAMDKQTRQIIAFHVGDRSHESAKQLWANLPAVYREQAMFIRINIPSHRDHSGAQHKAITKHARKTNHIERFNQEIPRSLLRGYLVKGRV